MEGGHAARDAPIGFWRRTMVAPVSEEMFAGFVAMAVPQPPADPTPPQVVAYAELPRVGVASVVLCLQRRVRRTARAASVSQAEVRPISQAQPACAYTMLPTVPPTPLPR